MFRSAVSYFAFLSFFIVGVAMGADEIDSLKSAFLPPQRFKDHTPSFSVREVEKTFYSPTGEFRKKHWYVMDGQRHVAVFDPGMYEFDLITPDPAKAPTELAMPARYHWARHLGARINLCMWYDGFYISSNTHAFEFGGGGQTLTLTTIEKWTSKRTAECTRVLTLRCDPVLGYTADVTLKLRTKDGSKKTLEFTNFLAGDLASVWPDRTRYERTVFSPTGKAGFTSWFNNLASAEYSDDPSPGVRNGGIIAFMPDASGWGCAVARTGNYSFSLATCNVWMDQHNYVALPSAMGASGFYEVDLTYRLAFLPPEITSGVLKSSTTLFADRSAVMVRLGIDEGFESQPVSLTSPVRGLWSPNLKVSNTVAFSGTRSYEIDASASPGSFTGFFQSPQISLLENSTYRIECRIKSVGDNRASITADFYEWSPHTATRTAKFKTEEVAAADGWKKVTLDLKTPAWDPFVDLRFIAVGSGKAYFDDFSFKRISGPTATSQPQPIDRNSSSLMPASTLPGLEIAPDRIATPVVRQPRGTSSPAASSRLYDCSGRFFDRLPRVR